jgi:hypothetical protein
MRASIGGTLRDAAAPLFFYYAVAVAVPVLNGASLDRAFFEHVAFVVAVPPVVIALAAIVRGLVR